MIEINSFSKSYLRKKVLNNINLKLLDNRIYFLIGKNGSGKTTFIKCLLELEKYNGKILFSGKKLDLVRNDIFVIYDDIPLYDNLSGFQNIHLLLNCNNKYNKLEILDLKLLTQKKLEEKVKNYSLGERKKVALIAAILKKPKYLIVDEVSNGLDVESLEIIKKCFEKLRSNSLIFTTGHHFEFYEQIIDELLILNDCTISQIDNYKKGETKLYEIYKQYISCD